MSDAGIERRRRHALRVGAVAIVLAIALAFFDRVAFFEGYLIAWLFLIAISAGAMANLMIHDLTGGAWGAVLRPPLEAAASALPLLALLAIPLGFGLSDLYPWVRADAAFDALIAAKRWYLNVPFFVGRAVVILATWSALALALRRDWRARRVDPAPPPERKLSIAGLVLYFVLVSFAAVDWVGSLVPQWYSTAIGLRVGVAQTMAAFAFAVPMAAWSAAMRDEVEGSARDRQDMGNLLIMFVMMWAYIAFTEFLIIWAEDIPRETAWFLPRAQTSWHWVSIVLFGLNFGLPMVAMLFRGIKRRTRTLAAVCAIVLAGQWLDAVWLVAPSLRPEGLSIRPADVLLTIGLGGLWLALVLREAEGAAAAPVVARGAGHG